MKRRYRRISTDKAAVMSFNNGKDQIPCVIRDVSEGGIGLFVDSTTDIPDQFILTVKGEEASRACIVRWKESNTLGASFEGETLHWMTAMGWVLVGCAVMICVMMLLPLFEGHRTQGFWYMVVPVAGFGVLMVLFRRRLDIQN